MAELMTHEAAMRKWCERLKFVDSMGREQISGVSKLAYKSEAQTIRDLLRDFFNVEAETQLSVEGEKR